HTPQDFLDDFPFVYALVGVLAAEGSEASAKAIEGCAKRAIAAAKKNKGVDDNPADHFAFILGQVGKGERMKKLERILARHRRAENVERHAPQPPPAQRLPRRGLPRASGW